MVDTKINYKNLIMSVKYQNPVICKYTKYQVNVEFQGKDCLMT